MKWLKSIWNYLDGKKRRIAVLGGAATSVGALTGFLPLVIVGTVVTAVFGSADQVSKQMKKK